MTSRDFCYWLQGFMELQPLSRSSERLDLSAEQTVCIRQHLALVFKHEIDPSAGGAEVQSKLNAIHNAQQQGQHSPLDLQFYEKHNLASYAPALRPGDPLVRC